MYFLLSLLLHLALIFSMVVIWVGHAKPEKQPSMYVPSYAYQPPSEPPPAAQQDAPAREAPQQKQQQEAIDKQAVSISTQRQHLTDARMNTSTKVAEAIHLVGDKKTVPKPLIKLLGKALAAHLVYPKIAADFRVRGMAYVGFVLHPDGTLSNVQLVQSSHAGVLDNEAMGAVNAISPVKDVSVYLSQPRPMVIGIIFN